MFNLESSHPASFVLGGFHSFSMTTKNIQSLKNGFGAAPPALSN
jgi:hypothetical protein